MDLVRIISYIVGGLICGGMLGIGIVSLIPIESLNSMYFIVMPIGGALAGSIIAFFFARNRNAKLLQSSLSNQSETGLHANLSGWTVLTLVAIGILIASRFW